MRAVLDQQGGDHAAAAIELGLDHRAAARTIGIGLEVEDFGLQQQGLFQPVEAGLGLGRDFDVEHVAAQLFRPPARAAADPGARGRDWRPACPSC